MFPGFKTGSCAPVIEIYSLHFAATSSTTAVNIHITIYLKRSTNSETKRATRRCFTLASRAYAISSFVILILSTMMYSPFLPPFSRFSFSRLIFPSIFSLRYGNILPFLYPSRFPSFILVRPLYKFILYTCLTCLLKCLYGMLSKVKSIPSLFIYTTM